MRKITLFLALMVAMVTTAFAQGIDASKQYYLKSSGWAGTTKVTGYLNLSVGMVYNTHGLILEEKQALSIEEVWIGTNKATVISAMLASGTSGEAKHYIAAAEGQNASWQAVVTTDVNKALPLTFSQNTDGTYYISSDKGGFKLDKVDKNSATDTRLGLYTDGNATNAATWTLEEVAAEPAGLTVVSQSPAADVQVESLASITIEFNKAIKLDWEDPYANGAGTGGTATGGAATGGAATGTGTGSISCINLKARDMSNAAAAWLSQAVVDGNKITFKFEAAVKTTGTYTFTIPADLIVAAEGDEKYAGGEFTFKVLAIAAPTYKSSNFGPKPDYNNCYSLKYINVVFSENIEVAAGVESLKLMNGEEVVREFVVGDNAEVNGKTLELYLDESPIDPEATTTYKLLIPAGYVVTKGTNLALAADETISVKVVEPFVIKNITPANATTRNIVIECSEAIFDYNYHNYLKLRNTANGSEIAISADYTIEGNVLTITPATAVPNGTYTLEGLNKLTAASELSVTLPEGYTYTITVDAPLYDASEIGVTFNPDNGYSCESVKFSFAEVVEVVGAGPYAVVYNENDEVVTEITTYTQASLAAYRMNATFNLAEKITAAGTYTVKFNAAIIKGTESGKVYAGGEYEFTVTKRPVSITSVDAPRGDVEEIYPNYEILIKYADEVTVDTEKAVTMTVGENTYTATLTTEDGSWGYTISIVFDAEFAYGNYTFTIPAGLYTVNGTPNEKEVYEFTYAEPVPLKVVSITPAVGTVESFSAITIEFNTPVVCEYGFEFAGCYFMQDAYTWQPRQTVTFIATDMTSGELATISAPGEYVFDLTFAVEWGTKFADDQETKITWTIEGETTAIDAVNAEAENAVIYDLTGRRVEKITKAGVYVINGVKKVVK